MFPNFEDTAPVEVGWTSMAFLRGLGEDGDDSSDPDPDGDYSEMPHLSDAASGSSDAAEDPDETDSTGR